MSEDATEVQLDPLTFERVRRHEAEMREVRTRMKLAAMEHQNELAKLTQAVAAATSTHSVKVSALNNELKEVRDSYGSLQREIENKHSISMKDWSYNEAGLLTRVPQPEETEQ